MAPEQRLALREYIVVLAARAVSGNAMKKATFIRRLGEPWSGDARFYMLSEPVAYFNFEAAGEAQKTTAYVIVSAVVARAAYDGPVTYVFPATEEGEVITMYEMGGSFRGGMDHEHALEGMGFVLDESKETVH